MLGNLQGELWTRLTGLSFEPLGERLVLLSAGQDPRFLEGCRRALIFTAALEADRFPIEPTLGLDRANEDARASQAVGQRELEELWDTLLPGITT